MKTGQETNQGRKIQDTEPAPIHRGFIGILYLASMNERRYPIAVSLFKFSRAFGDSTVIPFPIPDETI